MKLPLRKQTGLISINKHPLISQANKVCGAIDRCGASKELTEAATLAHELMLKIDYYVDLIRECNDAYDESELARFNSEPDNKK